MYFCSSGAPTRLLRQLQKMYFVILFGGQHAPGEQWTLIIHRIIDLPFDFNNTLQSRGDCPLLVLKSSWFKNRTWLKCSVNGWMFSYGFHTFGYEFYL